MKISKLSPFLIVPIVVFIVFAKSIGVFFAQDDFVLINQFSGSSILVDIERTFGKPVVTHWRPIHNLYFLITGNLFDRDFQLYHLLTFLIHIFGAFLVYKISLLILKNRYARPKGRDSLIFAQNSLHPRSEDRGFFAQNKRGAIASSLFYAINPLHFVALTWISGNSTTIGFTFFVWSFYLYLQKKFSKSFVLFFVSVLASEAMIFTALIFLAWEIVNEKRIKNFVFMSLIGTLSLLITLLQFFVFKTSSVADYSIDISMKFFSTIKYYLIATLGFDGGLRTGKFSFLLDTWLVLLAMVVLIANVGKKEDRKLLLFFLFVSLVGLFPFVLIPNHLSPHYMSVSLFGLSMIVGFAFGRIKNYLVILLLGYLFVVNFFVVSHMYQVSWVTQRATLAKTYIEKIYAENKAPGDTQIFDDNSISSSLNAYYALGMGNAVTFWFADKNYAVCFTAFDNCYK